jgi:hypothetical protein
MIFASLAEALGNFSRTIGLDRQRTFWITCLPVRPTCFDEALEPEITVQSVHILKRTLDSTDMKMGSKPWKRTIHCFEEAIYRFILAQSNKNIIGCCSVTTTITGGNSPNIGKNMPKMGVM